MRTSLKISAIAVIAAMFLTVPASAVTLNLGGTGSGGVINFGGSNTDPNVDILTNGSVNDGSPNGTATSNALNNGGGPTTAALNLGGTGGPSDANGNVLLDLFGPGNGNDAAVALGSGGGTDGGAALDLFGNGSGGGSGAGGGTGSGDDLFGPSGGTSRASGTGLTGTGIRVASLDNNANAKCFAPDPTQIARLTSRHDYSAVTLSDWVNASSISIVTTNLCDGARNAITHDGNVARLQAFVNGNPVLKSFLAKQGRSASDVIAIDRKGNTLTVYVS